MFRRGGFAAGAFGVGSSFMTEGSLFTGSGTLSSGVAAGFGVSAGAASGFGVSVGDGSVLGASLDGEGCGSCAFGASATTRGRVFSTWFALTNAFSGGSPGLDGLS